MKIKKWAVKRVTVNLTEQEEAILEKHRTETGRPYTDTIRELIRSLKTDEEELKMMYIPRHCEMDQKENKLFDKIFGYQIINETESCFIVDYQYTEVNEGVVSIFQKRLSIAKGEVPEDAIVR